MDPGCLHSNFCNNHLRLVALNNNEFAHSLCHRTHRSCGVQDQGANTVGFLVWDLFPVISSSGVILTCALGERDSFYKGTKHIMRTSSSVPRLDLITSCTTVICNKKYIFGLHLFFWHWAPKILGNSFLEFPKRGKQLIIDQIWQE